VPGGEEVGLRPPAAAAQAPSWDRS
jgi:hypothetical protein